MQIIERYDVFGRGAIAASKTWARAIADVEAAIATVDWPHGSHSFTLNPTPILNRKGKLTTHANGVAPIKEPMLRHLEERGWIAESLPPIRPGEVLTKRDLDALLPADGLYIGFEWETGNISSSHRAMNKLTLALDRATIAGGVLVLPMKATQRYLTDRVGSFEELRPYFPLWERYPLRDGVLRIYGLGHDHLSTDVEHIPKKDDGRASI
jgi:hypothetical protein